VRKRLVEIQYFRTTITDEQRQEFGAAGRLHDPADRVDEFLAAQWHSVSAEPLQQLPLCGTVPGETRTSRSLAG